MVLEIRYLALFVKDGYNFHFWLEIKKMKSLYCPYSDLPIKCFPTIYNMPILKKVKNCIIA